MDKPEQGEESQPIIPYSELDDKMLAIAHMTWEQMATQKLEQIQSVGGFDKANQEDLNAFGWYMHHYAAIMDEFKTRMQALKFSIQEIYQYVGRTDRSGIFRFYPGSPAHRQFGEEAQGVVLYSKRERDTLEQEIQSSPVPRTDGVIRIKSHKYQESEQNVDLLKSQGFEVTEVMELLTFSMDDNAPHIYADKAIKEIPNTIDIKLNLNGIDPAISFLHLIEYQKEAGVPIPRHEMVRYYAYLSFIKPESVTHEIASEYLIDPDTGAFSDEITYEILNAKFDRGDELSTLEQEQFKAVSSKIITGRVELVLKGLGISKKTYAKLRQSNSEAFWGIIGIARDFQTETVSGPESKYPIFWDFDRFAHVLTRHYKGFKIAESTYFSNPVQQPTAFQYTYRDTIRLVKIVVKNLSKEIDARLSNGEPFSRQGQQAYYYNGNYYAIRIAPNGRLMQFHPLQ
ncbi:hypothetical protein GCM10023172_23280 [Hymenobacter ginsengisoli]|uniref:Uncharacterized protein n=1 Tax=Hymenobacter ginsengisoli TaxID=1051626 RepID=A0ABP8QF00_9BACT|nr:MULTISPECIES: hypothetical protein [unclassified Hymenobacter]MBO2033277.1 hypothetical protein [Hymenobacter sp. BT559]